MEGDGNKPPKISGTTKGMAMAYLPDVGIYKRALYKKADITLVCRLQNKLQIRKKRFLEIQLRTMLTSKRFAGLSILTSDQIDISKIRYFIELSVKCRKKLVCSV